MTTSHDNYVKIFDIEGNLISALNINHPLPLKWGLDFDKNYDIYNKILFSLKVVESIFKRYYNMLYMEGKIFNLKAFLEQYRIKKEDSEEGNKGIEVSNVFRMTEVRQNEEIIKKKGVVLMQDEYEPKDFSKGIMSKFYRDELLGPNLEHMEAKRRIATANETWSSNLKLSDKVLLRNKDMSKKKNQKTKFFDTLKTNRRIDVKGIIKSSKYVRRLVRKLDDIDLFNPSCQEESDLGF